MLTRYYESAVSVPAGPEELFEHLDEHSRLSGHMSKSSWLMGGGKMRIDTNPSGGRIVGSHIRLSGRVWGIRLAVDEVVTARVPPHEKTWQTVGEPRLIVIGTYRMGFTVTPRDDASQLRVFIDYELPSSGLPRLLGRLVGGWYARWCTQQMLNDTLRYFSGRTTSAAGTHRPLCERQAWNQRMSASPNTKRVQQVTPADSASSPDHRL